jgi:hypothetical protein
MSAEFLKSQLTFQIVPRSFDFSADSLEVQLSFYKVG